jgi:sulfide:quinone oxidoreductase
MFGVKHYAEKLEALRKERGVIAMFRRELISLDVDKKVATFKNLDTNQMVQQNYDLIHVVPHMCAPDFIRDSKLANKDGWVDVDKHTMQSTKYQNVFGLGDCTSTPNSKTAAAITSQAPVVVHNIIRSIESNKPLDGKYNGYASCPLIVARNRVILAEFGYDGKLMETFSRETGQFPLNMFGTEGAIQQRFFFFLKEQLFPFVYWKMWVHGRWYGAKGPFKPDVRDKDATQGK